MKNILLGLLAFLACVSIHAQSEILKLDFENASFQNFPNLPFGDPFVVEGEIQKTVQMVEVSVSYAGSKKNLNTYVWNRADNNNSENFELFISNPLKSNEKYDFKVTTFYVMTEA